MDNNNNTNVPTRRSHRIRGVSPQTSHSPRRSDRLRGISPNLMPVQQTANNHNATTSSSPTQDNQNQQNTVPTTTSPSTPPVTNLTPIPEFTLMNNELRPTPTTTNQATLITNSTTTPTATTTRRQLVIPASTDTTVNHIQQNINNLPLEIRAHAQPNYIPRPHQRNDLLMQSSSGRGRGRNRTGTISVPAFRTEPPYESFAPTPTDTNVTSSITSPTTTLPTTTAAALMAPLRPNPAPTSNLETASLPTSIHLQQEDEASQHTPSSFGTEEMLQRIVNLEVQNQQHVTLIENSQQLIETLREELSNERTKHNRLMAKSMHQSFLTDLHSNNPNDIRSINFHTTVIENINNNLHPHHQNDPPIFEIDNSSNSNITEVYNEYHVSSSGSTQQAPDHTATMQHPAQNPPQSLSSDTTQHFQEHNLIDLSNTTITNNLNLPSQDNAPNLLNTIPLPPAPSSTTPIQNQQPNNSVPASATNPSAQVPLQPHPTATSTSTFVPPPATFTHTIPQVNPFIPPTSMPQATQTRDVTISSR